MPVIAAVIALGIFAAEGFGAAATFVDGAIVFVVLVAGAYIVYRVVAKST